MSKSSRPSILDKLKQQQDDMMNKSSSKRPRILDKQQQDDMMNKYIVFVETKRDLYLDNVISFSQYIYNQKILITFIGELHKEKFKCDGDGRRSLSIANYCTNAVKRNPKCIVFLEFNEDEEIDKLKWEGSTIKETFDSLLLSGFVPSQIIPFDERPKLITREKQNDLYWADWSSFKNHEFDFYGYILTSYIEPLKGYILLYESVDKFINKTSYNELQNYQLFLKTELNVIEQFIEKEQSEFNFVKQNLESLTDEELEIRIKQFLSKSLKTIQEIYLQIFWAKVSDFYLLKKLFSVNDCNECIVLLGEAHKRNICDLLDKFNEENKIYKNLINYNNGSDYSKNCINIFKTVMVGSIPP